MKQQITCLTLILFSVTFCGEIPEQNAKLKRIIGRNDLKPVMPSSKNQQVVEAVGVMEIGCTVTHIGEGLAITAAHCFTNKRTQSPVVDRDCDHELFSVTWGVTKTSQGYLKSKCEKILVFEYSDTLDYAVIQVDNVPRKKLKLNWNSITKGDLITIFSHPKQRPLESSGWCKVEGYIHKSDSQQIRYSCDTQKGSSGAAVLNQDLEIIGIHNFYNGLHRRNGATLLNQTLIANVT